MAAVGRAMSAAGVRRIYLVHGTHGGLDAFGIATALGRWHKAWGEALGRTYKRIVDRVLGERGNFTEPYARLLEDALNDSSQRGQSSHIEVRRFNWSSENHHLGRADGAVRLIDLLTSEPLAPGQRHLLIGHSHAGNVFALMTQLIAGHRPRTARFFRAARIFYWRPWRRDVDLPVWRRVQLLLREHPRPFADTPLDIVTYGTPVRYGWDAAGYDRLLHFVFHRCRADTPEHLIPFPPRLGQVSLANAGDFIQQIGIAGTNFVPLPLPFISRVWLADRRLAALLQPSLEPRCLWSRLKMGTRAHDRGENLLIDYKPANRNVWYHLAGHGLYTRREWMLWQCEEIARRLYPGGALDAAAAANDTGN